MKIKLNKFKILLPLVMLSMLTFSCKDEESAIPFEEANKIIFTEELELRISSTKSDGSIVGNITGVFDENIEEVTTFKLSDNILKALKMSQREFEIKLAQKLTQKADDGEHKDCMEDCKDKYTDEDGTKLKGRGGCKFACWVDTVVELAKELVPAFL